MDTDTCSLLAPTPEDLPPSARLLLEKFPEERVFAFFAPMGAGKTTFIQSLCQCLGVKDRVVS
ncbi:MAG: tRNA (adenosine(37)-N6)-threonylcarbamoyltransferase complex ATPase subunit type 1 TsaE, partial [Bacteroidales bacterium]|nr:tRNA (adenosine(37)-N6)-threonylcarbamoyltransferase complex ATPase subunit type 1 TsaE [Bacteroidales bacterium]